MATLSLPQSLQGKLTSVPLRTGLVLGFQVEQRFFALSLAFTPHTALPAAPTSLDTLLSSQLADDPETNYSDWVIEHARQAQRLLPAGISVLGLFVCSADEVLHDFKSKPPLLRTLIALAEDVNREILHRDSVLMVHFLGERQKWAGRAVDSKDSRVNVVEVKTGAGTKLEEIRGIYKMEAHFSEQQMTVREGVEKIVTNVASKLNIDRFLISHKLDGPLPPLKSDTDFHSLDILSSSISSHLSHTRPPKAQISVSGAIETRSYVPPKTSVQLATEVVRSDIVQSLRYRLSLYCEGDGETAFARHPKDSKAGLYSLPCRVFYRTEAGVAVCDYMAEGESKDQSKQRVTDLTGFVITGDGESAEQLRKTARRDTEQSGELLSPRLQTGGASDTVKSTPYWKYAAAALVFAVLLRLIFS